MSDKENEGSVENIEQDTQNSFNTSQAEETFAILRDKQAVLDHAENNVGKLTIEDALELAEDFCDYQNIRNVIDENPSSIILDASDAVRRMELVTRALCGNENGESFDIQQFCDFLIETSESLIDGDLTKREWVTLGTGLNTDFVMDGGENDGINLLLGTFKIQESDPEVVFQNADVHRLNQLARKQGKTLNETIAEITALDAPSQAQEFSVLHRTRYKNEDREGETQDIKAEEDAESNRDEKEQKRLLEFLLKHWRTSEGDEPFFYWEVVMSDTFSETIENIFYLSFLLKLGVIVAWENPDYNAVVMVPNYKKIKTSKFGSDPKEKSKKKNRARYEVNEALLKKTKEYESVYTQFHEKLKRKHERDPNPAEIGGNQQLSRQGAVSMSVEEWEDWIQFFKNRDNGQFQKFFPTRAETINLASGR